MFCQEIFKYIDITTMLCAKRNHKHMITEKRSNSENKSGDFHNFAEI